MLRFAPNTTGDMDINNLRVGIFNYIISKQKNENLVIRIDDINKEKYIEGKDKEILEILNLFSIEYANVFNQSSNLKYHQKMAMQLLSSKKAFSCFCSDEKLDELKEETKTKKEVYKYDNFCEKLSDETVLNVNAPFTVRIKNANKNIKFKDILLGELDFNYLNLDSFIILNHDKTPTYDYACAIDDMIMDISTVIRSDEYIENTPNQIHVRNSLGYDKDINYLHLPSIENSCLVSVKSLIDEGFLPSAIANYLVLIGNNTPKEIFTLEEAITWFDIKTISKTTEVFDMEKLKSINKIHLEMLDELRLSKILGFADEDIGKLAKLFLEEVNTIKEIKEKISSIFNEKNILKSLEKETEILKNCIKNAPFFDDFEKFKEYIAEKTKLDEEALFKNLRYILTGKQNGPDLSKIYPLIKNYLGEIVK